MAEFKTTQQEKFHDRATLAWEVDSYSPVNQYKLLFRKVKVRMYTGFIGTHFRTLDLSRNQPPGYL